MANNYYQPLTSSDASYPWENSDFDRAYLGFANRDEHNTAANSCMPVNVRSVGDPWHKYYHGWKYGDQEITDRPLPVMSSDAQTPALCVLTVEPTTGAIKALNDPQRVDVNIWNTLWRDINYINRVYNVQFEAIDLQFTQFMMEEIVGHVSNLFRAMDAARITDNPMNAALRKDNLLYGLGFTAHYPRGYVEDFRGLVDFVNTEILGQLNQQWWCWDFIPSTFRRAALFSAIYADNEDPNSFSTLFAFTPNVMQFPTRNEENSMWETTRLPIPDNLWDYARLIKSMIDFMLADLDFINIQTAMQSIMEKKRELANGVSLTKSTFDYYPYFGRPLDITYSAGMLLAIRNATITGNTILATGLKTKVGEGDRENELYQIFQFDNSTVKNKFFMEYLRGSAAYDMPANWTPDDWAQMILASQWKLMIPDNQPDTDASISPQILGTEFIAQCYIYYLHGADRNITPGFITLDPMLYRTTTPQVMRLISAVSQINFMPMMPYVQYTEANYPGERLVIYGYTGDIKHISFCEFEALRSVKQQFLRNALGYPILLAKYGEFFGSKEAADAVADTVSRDVTKQNSATGSASPKVSRRAAKAVEASES